MRIITQCVGNFPHGLAILDPDLRQLQANLAGTMVALQALGDTFEIVEVDAALKNPSRKEPYV